MVSNGFSIGDPDPLGMLDVVGFDSATPQLVSDSPAAQSEEAGRPSSRPGGRPALAG
jgi:hypothetical protein